MATKNSFLGSVVAFSATEATKKRRLLRSSRVCYLCICEYSFLLQTSVVLTSPPSSSGKDIKVSTPPTQSTTETPTTASFALSSPPPTYLNDNYYPLHEYDTLSDTSTAVFSHAKSINDAPPSPSSISSTHTVYPRFELSSIVAPSVLSRQVEPHHRHLHVHDYEG